MKKFFMALFCVALCARAAHAEPLRVWLIYDPSYETQQISPDIEAMAKAAIRGLEDGDRLRQVIATRRDSPHILTIDQIGPNQRSREDLTLGISELYHWSASKVNLARAVELPLALIGKGGESRLTDDRVIIFSSGRMSDEQALRVVAACEKLEAAGAKVVLTGAHDCNPLILLACARGRITWKEIPTFSPEEWIQSSRRAAKPAQPAPNPAPVEKQSPAAAAPGATTPPTQSAAPNPNESRAPVNATPGNALAAKPSVPVPLSPKKLLEFNILVTAPGEKTTEVPVSVAAAPSALPSSTGTPSERVKAETPLPPAESRPAPASPPAGPTASSAKPPGPAPKLRTPAPASRIPVASGAPARPTPVKPAARLPATTAWKIYRIAAVPLALLLAVLGGLALRDLRRARQRTGSQTSAGVEEQRPCEVIARFNGVERVLGRPETLRQFHVGSGASNTLRIPETGVEEQHALFHRDRSGAWSVRNLSRKPLEANGTPVNPGRTVGVDFPAAVRLTDRVSFNLFVRPVSRGQDSSEAPEPDAVRSAANG